MPPLASCTLTSITIVNRSIQSPLVHMHIRDVNIIKAASIIPSKKCWLPRTLIMTADVIASEIVETVPSALMILDRNLIITSANRERAIG